VEGDFNALVMQRLGSSLEELHIYCSKLSLCTVLQLAVQMLNILEYVHAKGFIHGFVELLNF
jgi:serine/threonine protein kinase